MKNTDFLQKLGFGESESRVYLALLESGSLGVSEISRKTGLYRVDVYRALEVLQKESFVSASFKGKYKVYSAESPKKLESRFVELSNEFDQKIAELVSLKRIEDPKRPVIKYLEGEKGITEVHDDIVMTLKKGDVYYRYSSAKVTNTEKRKNYLSKKYRIIRDQKQIERKVITNVANKAGKRVRLEREIKVVPPDFDMFEYNISQVIYGNKVAVLDYNTETAVIVEDPTIAKFQAKIFELLFRKL